jgi:hypothetical protein
MRDRIGEMENAIVVRHHNNGAIGACRATAD